MKNITKYIIPVFILIILINPASGFEGMGNNNMTTGQDGNVTLPDIKNITQSDQDIILLQHLIELDSVQLASENKIFIRETLTFKNAGTKHFSGTLRTWVPDGAENIGLARVEMRANAMPAPIMVDQKGNIISWQDIMDKDDPIPPLYIIQYTVPAEPEGTFSESKYYSKKFLYPTLVTKKPLSIIVKITSGEGESITLTDEKGNSISESGNPTEEEGNSVLYGWEIPGFTEINLKLSKSTVNPAQVAGYVIPGILILLVFTYPIIRKKSEKIQDIEEKLKNTLKREPEEEIEEESPEEAHEVPEVTIQEDIRAEEAEEVVAPAEGQEIPGKTEELENEKNEILSKIANLEKDYSSGNLLDEEYEELREEINKKLEKINERIKTAQNM